jgi:hypothetical protein
MKVLTVHIKTKPVLRKYFSGINIKVSLSSLSVCLSSKNAALLTTNSTNQTDQEKKRLEMDGLEIEGLGRGDWRGRVCWAIRESENTSADFVPKLGFFADFLWREKKRCCNRLVVARSARFSQFMRLIRRGQSPLFYSLIVQHIQCTYCVSILSFPHSPCIVQCTLCLCMGRESPQIFAYERRKHFCWH